MKIISWNVNGIRAVAQKGFLNWFEQQNADIVCLQETKAHQDQLDASLINPLNYHSKFFSAQKKGYSSVVTYSKKEPIDIHVGMNIDEFDNEGRVLTYEFLDSVVINAYFPNSQEAGARLDYKLRFCEAMLKFCESFRQKGKNVILCGDYNIAHTPIDLKNPKANEKNAGYLPEERAWMTKFLGTGYVDAFRKFEKGPEHYTWWSYRFSARSKNIGWRIDYFATNPEFEDQLKSCTHQHTVKGSDHCPIVLETK
jgi:exodeoxyribonuclease-3